MGKKANEKKQKAKKKMNGEIKISPTQENDNFYKDEKKITTEKNAVTRAIAPAAENYNYHEDKNEARKSRETTDGF